MGYRVRGGMGAPLVSAIGVILPSFLLLVILSFFYFRLGQIPAVGRLFPGFIPAVAAIILAAAWNMGTKAITGAPEALIALAAAGLLLGVGGFTVTLGIIGMIAAAGVTVARTAPFTGTSALIFAAALAALLRFKMETAWIIPAAGIAGLLLY